MLAPLLPEAARRRTGKTRRWSVSHFYFKVEETEVLKSEVTWPQLHRKLRLEFLTLPLIVPEAIERSKKY